MQRYLRPDLLAAAGIEVFDTWAATFGQVVSQVELAPEGGSNFRMKSPVRPVRQRPGDAADAARGRRREDRRGPGPARPGPQAARRRAARAGNRDRRAVRRTARLCARPRRPGRQGPQPGGGPGRGQHAQDLRRRPPRRAGPAAARLAADNPGQDQPRPPTGSPRSGLRTRTTSTSTPAVSRTRCADRCSWCSATWARPGRAGTSTTSSATSSSRVACRVRRSGSSTRPRPTGTRRSCLPPAAPAGSPS